MKTKKTRDKLASQMATIEELFAFYLMGTKRYDLDPMAEEGQRHAFFSGFDACRMAMELLSVIFEEDEEHGEIELNQLIAEFEKFAQEYDSGKRNTIH